MSVVCCIVPSKGFEPMVRDLTRAATSRNLGTVTECRATLVHLIYMCLNSCRTTCITILGLHLVILKFRSIKNPISIPKCP